MNYHTYVHHILVLKEYITRIVGPHYPLELVGFILMLTYERLTLNCGFDNTSLVGNRAYFLGYSYGTSDDNKNIPHEITLEDTHAKIVSIAHGRSHSVAVVLTKIKSIPVKKIYVWGKNKDRQLGFGNYGDRSSPTELHLPKNIRGSDVVEPKSFPYEIWKSPLENAHKCVHFRGAAYKIYVWGSNNNGNLGLGSWGDEPLPTELDLNDVVTVSCGAEHSVALLESGILYVWGYTGLRLGSNRSPKKLILDEVVVAISCGSEHTMALVDSGFIYGWGSNGDGQLGLGHYKSVYVPEKIIIHEFVVSVRCGRSHSMALTSVPGLMYIWGNNENGQLGLGHNKNRYGYGSIPRKLFLCENILTIHCGENHSCVATINNKIYVWGSNRMGQLGLGDFIDRNYPQELQIR